MKTCKWIILILYVQLYDSLDERNFRCKSGEYISNEWFCNGKFDCHDRSDETERGCWKSHCKKGEFGCDSTCKNATVRCNTILDCNDGTDELNCGDEINTNNCTWQNVKYLCDDNLRCLDFNYTCDGKCNCFDCSDEKASCWSDEAPNLACFRTPLGPHCCSEFDSICQKCSKNHCQQKCIQFRQEQKCLCDENYIGVAGTNNSKCVNLAESKENLDGLITSHELNSFAAKNQTVEITPSKAEEEQKLLKSLVEILGTIVEALGTVVEALGPVFKILGTVLPYVFIIACITSSILICAETVALCKSHLGINFQNESPTGTAIPLPSPPLGHHILTEEDQSSEIDEAEQPEKLFQ